MMAQRTKRSLAHDSFLIRWIFLFSGIFLMWPGACAQDENDRRLVLSIGPGSLHRQDLIFSPFIHKDVAPLTVGLSFRKDKTSHSYLDLEYAGYSAGLKTPYEYIYDGETETAYPHSFTFIHLGYGCGKYVGNRESKRSIPGISLHFDVQALDYQYGRVSFFGYYAAIGAGVWYKRHFQLGENHRVTTHIELPLVSWVTRSPYLVNDDEFIENIYSHNGLKTFFAYLGDGHLTTLNQLQRINAGIEYTFLLSKSFSLGAGWKFNYLHMSKPIDLYSLEQHFRAILGIAL